jgi:uncharacterized membrane protein
MKQRVKHCSGIISGVQPFPEALYPPTRLTLLADGVVREEFSMEKSRVVLLVAVVLFLASFFLPAVFISGFSSGLEGYICAYFALISPWANDWVKDWSAHPIAYPAVLVSGLINLVFLITAILLWRKRAQKAAGILRIVLLSILPACWIVFAGNHMKPGPGYFLWTASMGLALFSDALSGHILKSAKEQASSATLFT